MSYVKCECLALSEMRKGLAFSKMCCHMDLASPSATSITVVVLAYPSAYPTTGCSKQEGAGDVHTHALS